MADVSANHLGQLNWSILSPSVSCKALYYESFCRYALSSSELVGADRSFILLPRRRQKGALVVDPSMRLDVDKYSNVQGVLKGSTFQPGLALLNCRPSVDWDERGRESCRTSRCDIGKTPLDFSGKTDHSRENRSNTLLLSNTSYSLRVPVS